MMDWNSICIASKPVGLSLSVKGKQFSNMTQQFYVQDKRATIKI